MAKDLVPVTTPISELHWVQISGQGKQNYNEDGYNYVATVHLKGEDAEGLKSKIDDVLGEVPKGKTVKSTGYRRLMKHKESDDLRTPDKNGVIKVDGEDVTAEYEESDIWAFTFTTSTTFGEGEKAKPKTISVYNKDAKKVDLGDRKIGNGSVGAISGKMRRYERGKEIGVSLFLNAVQLTNFTEYEGGAGFEEQEGDFDGVTDEDTGFTGQPESGGSKEKPKL